MARSTQPAEVKKVRRRFYKREWMRGMLPYSVSIINLVLQTHLLWRIDDEHIVGWIGAGGAFTFGTLAIAVAVSFGTVAFAAVLDTVRASLYACVAHHVTPLRREDPRERLSRSKLSGSVEWLMASTTTWQPGHSERRRRRCPGFRELLEIDWLAMIRRAKITLQDWLEDRKVFQGYWLLLVLIRCGWALTYLIYVARATRLACFHDHPAATRCLPWDVEGVPTSLYVTDAVLLWCLNIQFLIRICVSKAKLRYMFSLKGIFELVQLPGPLVLLVCLMQLSTYTTALAEPERKSFGLGEIHLLNISLRFGFMHWLILVRTSYLESLLTYLLEAAEAQVRARVFAAGIKMFSILFFYAGLMHALVGAEYECASLRSFFMSVDAELSDEHRALLSASQLEAFADGARASHPAHAHSLSMGGRFHTHDSSRLDVGLVADLFAALNVTASVGADELNALDEYGWCSRSAFPHYSDYLYYTITTVSTVGYGDWSPFDYPTRAVAVFMMLTLMLWLPYQITQLVEMYVLPSYSIGKLPSPWHDFVCLFGPVSPSQLAMFVHEFLLLRSSAEANTHIVLLSPLPLEDYRLIIEQAPTGHALRTRLYVHHGDVLSLQQGSPGKHGNAGSTGSHLGFTAAGNKFVDLHQAKAFFVFSYPESALPLDEDRSTIIRCLVLRKLLSDSLMCRIVLQLNRARDKQLALDLGVNSVTSLNELKMATLALSCTRCFGLTTLLGNLLYARRQGNDRRRRRDKGAKAAANAWAAEYLYGASHEVYQVELPACCHGVVWTDVVSAIYSQLGIMLIARLCPMDPAAAASRPPSPDSSTHGPGHGHGHGHGQFGHANAHGPRQGHGGAGRKSTWLATSSMPSSSEERPMTTLSAAKLTSSLASYETSQVGEASVVSSACPMPTLQEERSSHSTNASRRDAAASLEGPPPAAAAAPAVSFDAAADADASPPPSPPDAPAALELVEASVSTSVGRTGVLASMKSPGVLASLKTPRRWSHRASSSSSSSSPPEATATATPTVTATPTADGRATSKGREQRASAHIGNLPVLSSEELGELGEDSKSTSGNERGSRAGFGAAVGGDRTASSSPSDGAPPRHAPRAPAARATALVPRDASWTRANDPPQPAGCAGTV